MKIIGFAGQTCAGKTTIANIVLEHVTGSFVSFCLGQAVKSDARCFVAERQLNLIIALDRIAESSREVVVISDVESEVDAQWIKNLGGVVVDVKRPGLRLDSIPDLHADCIDFTFYNHGNLDDLQTVVPAALSCWLAEAMPVHMAKQKAAAQLRADKAA